MDGLKGVTVEDGGVVITQLDHHEQVHRILWLAWILSLPQAGVSAKGV